MSVVHQEAARPAAAASILRRLLRMKHQQYAATGNLIRWKMLQL